MKINAIQSTSLLDFPGKISLITFTPECTYRCPSCHAGELVNGNLESVNEEEVLGYLDKKKKWIDGVVLCGGEPTTQKDLPEFAKKIKDRGLEVKLDTNGSNPEMLQDLVNNHLVDYVAMDIKGPKRFYPQLTGVDRDYSNEVEECMKILSQSDVDYELRTTIVPRNDYDFFEWFNVNDMEETAQWIADVSGKGTKYFLQKFVAREESEMICEKFSKSNLIDRFYQTPDSLLYALKQTAEDYGLDCKIRGKD